MPKGSEETERSNSLSPFSRGFIVYLALALAIPVLVGGILSAIFRDLIYLEGSALIGGCLELIVWLWRPRARESAHYRKEKTLVEDKETKEYKRFTAQQLWIFLAALACLAVSLIAFLIRRFTA